MSISQVGSQDSLSQMLNLRQAQGSGAEIRADRENDNDADDKRKRVAALSGVGTQLDKIA